MPQRPGARPTSSLSLDACFTQLQQQCSVSWSNMVAACRFGTVPARGGPAVGRGGGSFVRGRGAAMVQRGRGVVRGGFVARGVGRGAARGGFIPRGSANRGRNLAGGRGGAGGVRGTMRGRGNARGGRGRGRGGGRGGKVKSADDLDTEMDTYMGRDPEEAKHSKLDAGMESYWNSGEGGDANAQAP